MCVTATAAALEAIARLRGLTGGWAFFQSGGCCDGSSPMCLTEGELPVAAGDRLLGQRSAARRSTSTPTSTSAGGGPSSSSTCRREPPRASPLSPSDGHFVSRTRSTR